MSIRVYALLAATTAAVALTGCKSDRPTALAPSDSAAAGLGPANPAFVDQGKITFRFDTYGDETFWTDTLRMHEVISKVVTPALALSVGLKVDVDALPEAVKTGLKNGTLKVTDPANTVALLKLGAVVGLVGKVNAKDSLTSVGTTCALCHSTVDNSFDVGIGRRLDGWPNRDLNVGAIIALSPTPTQAQKAVYQSWGPGMYDPRFNIDGKNIPVVIPAAFGLRHVKREIYTGDDTISYWNAYVAITQMHGHGRFTDPRIGVDVNNPPDLVSSKLAALRAYQFSLDAPEPMAGIDDAAARRGNQIFNKECATCHVGSVYTDITQGILHTPIEVGQDAAYAMRSATKRYRTTPLRGLWHPPQLDGPYFHDGKAGTLEAVVDHYVRLRSLVLTAQQKSDLIAYLKTL